MVNAPRHESRSRMSKFDSQKRSRLSLGDPNSASTIMRYTAATENQLENQPQPTYVALEEDIME